jgi:hypothetical protein
MSRIRRTGPIGYECSLSSRKHLHIKSDVVHQDYDVGVHAPGEKLKVDNYRSVLAFPMMVSGSFAPAAFTPVITVIPSFSSFSI